MGRSASYVAALAAEDARLVAAAFVVVQVGQPLFGTTVCALVVAVGEFDAAKRASVVLAIAAKGGGLMVAEVGAGVGGAAVATAGGGRGAVPASVASPPCAAIFVKAVAAGGVVAVVYRLADDVAAVAGAALAAPVVPCGVALVGGSAAGVIEEAECGGAGRPQPF